MMSQKRLISQELVQVVESLVFENFPWAKDAMILELQDDYQFLLISIECEMCTNLTEDERRELARQINRLMPTRDNELTWMLNFTANGKVADSYFGGDAKSPEIGF